MIVKGKYISKLAKNMKSIENTKLESLLLLFNRRRFGTIN
jgi:hypothetical protein